MKNFLSTVVFLFSTTVIFSQSFSKFENNKDVSSLVINKELFSEIKIDENVKNEEERKIVNFLNKIEFVKIFSTSNEVMRKDMKSIAKKYKENRNLEQLMKFTDGGKEASFLMRTNRKDELEELMIFVEGSGDKNSVLILFSLG